MSHTKLLLVFNAKWWNQMGRNKFNHLLLNHKRWESSRTCCCWIGGADKRTPLCSFHPLGFLLKGSSTTTKHKDSNCSYFLCRFWFIFLNFINLNLKRELRCVFAQRFFSHCRFRSMLFISLADSFCTSTFWICFCSCFSFGRAFFPLRWAIVWVCLFCRKFQFHVSVKRIYVKNSQLNKIFIGILEYNVLPKLRDRFVFFFLFPTHPHHSRYSHNFYELKWMLWFFLFLSLSLNSICLFLLIYTFFLVYFHSLRYHYSPNYFRSHVAF